MKPVFAAVVALISVSADPAVAEDCGYFLVPLKRPYVDDVGHSVMLPFPDLARVADTKESPERSPLVVCEDGKAMGPGHVDHVDIFNIGLGRYSHYGDWLRFSSTDNTDPNTNGRQYDVALNDASLVELTPKFAQDNFIQNRMISALLSLVLLGAVATIALSKLRHAK